MLPRRNFKRLQALAEKLSEILNEEVEEEEEENPSTIEKGLEETSEKGIQHEQDLNKILLPYQRNLPNIDQDTEPVPMINPAPGNIESTLLIDNSDKAPPSKMRKYSTGKTFPRRDE